MSSIEVRALSKSFGRVCALDDISFHVPEGSLMALLGPSGGGKSTALRAITGLEVPDSGSVLIDGVDVTRVPVRSRGIGFCFQHYAPFRHMTVAQNVAFGLKVRRRPKSEIASRVRELLELVRLHDLAERYPSQLSGGQRQRMALARALAVKPKVLLLDEPFGALDAQVRQELRIWLRDLVEEVRVTTVLVTHDQEEAMEVADQIAIINNGRLEQVGTPSECYDHPVNNFVLTFLGSATRHNGLLVRPHDLALSTEPAGRSKAGSRRGEVSRITRLGFDARVEVSFDDDTTTTVQLARQELDELAIERGDLVTVSLRSLGERVLVDADRRPIDRTGHRATT